MSSRAAGVKKSLDPKKVMPLKKVLEKGDSMLSAKAKAALSMPSISLPISLVLMYQNNTTQAKNSPQTKSSSIVKSANAAAILL